MHASGMPTMECPGKKQAAQHAEEMNAAKEKHSDLEDQVVDLKQQLREAQGYLIIMYFVVMFTAPSVLSKRIQLWQRISGNEFQQQQCSLVEIQ